MQVSSPGVAQAQSVQQQTVQLVPAVQATQPLVQSPGGTGVQTALVLREPHLLNRMLGAIGRHLAQKGNPVLMMTNTATPVTVQVPTTVLVQSPGVSVPQQPVVSTPTVQSPPPVVASPQTGHTQKFGLFHRND
jgi:hypothetical protein